MRGHTRASLEPQLTERFVCARSGRLSSSFAPGDDLVRCADVAQLVAHHLAKVRVAGSNPVVRSKVQVASIPAVEWPSGEATACKAVHTGSIPVSTSRLEPPARLAQRESASLTRKRSLVQSQYRAPRLAAETAHPGVAANDMLTTTFRRVCVHVVAVQVGLFSLTAQHGCDVRKTLQTAIV
jgi:hypothetical protein